MSTLINPTSDDGWAPASEGKFSVNPESGSILLEFTPDPEFAGVVDEVVGGSLTVSINNLTNGDAILALQTVLDDLRANLA